MNGCDVIAPLTHAMVVYVLNGPSVFIEACHTWGRGVLVPVTDVPSGL